MDEENNRNKLRYFDSNLFQHHPKIRKGKTLTKIEICFENKKVQKRAGKKRRKRRK